MSGHTPGPWSIKPGVFNYQIDIRVGGNTLATVYGSTGENLCNAQLIAAAPKLLAACEKALAWMQSPSSFAAAELILAEAIHEAKGEA